MPTQAIPLALLASLYPFGLAALILLFAASRPRPRSALFLVGATACLLLVGFLFVFVLRGAGLSNSGSSTPRYGLRLALGVAFLVGAWVVAHRPQKQERPADQPSRVNRAVAGSGLLAVFLVGMVMYTPSPTYLAALNVVGTTKMSTASTAVWVIVVVVLVLITIEIPIALYLLAPAWTVPKLDAFNGWLGRNSRLILVSVLAVLGVWQVIDGLVGLL